MADGRRVHEEEVRTDEALARRLLAEQCPQWATLRLARVHADSTDHDMYRLGADLALRLPRRASAVRSMEKEHAWLPRLAPHLPVAVPLPRARGTAAEGFPYPWAVVGWIEGDLPPPRVDDPDFARDLASFVRGLHGLDATGGPPPGAHNFGRGRPLAQQDAELRERFDWLADLPDLDALVAAWEAHVVLPAWDRAPTWIHGDLARGNLLVRGGRLAGVLDWSALGVGDPAGDLSVAWSLFGPRARAEYRAATETDETTWARGRAWALVEGVLALSYYRGRNEALAQAGRRLLDAVLADR